MSSVNIHTYQVCVLYLSITDLENLFDYKLHVHFSSTLIERRVLIIYTFAVLYYNIYVYIQRAKSI